MAKNDHTPMSPRKRKYLNERVKGKTKREAALAAGYSHSVAMSATAHIETPDFKEAFAKAIRHHIPANRIAERVSEGLDATETKLFCQDGQIIESEPRVAWSERRQYAALAAEYGGYFTPAAKDVTAIQVNFTVRDRSEAEGSVKKIFNLSDSSESEEEK